MRGLFNAGKSFSSSALKSAVAIDIAIAIAQGKYKGRPKSISPAPILELLNGGLSMRKTAERLGISLSTVQRVKIENRLVVGVNDA